jgi:hypothetical protein
MDFGCAITGLTAGRRLLGGEEHDAYLAISGIGSMGWPFHQGAYAAAFMQLILGQTSIRWPTATCADWEQGKTNSNRSLAILCSNAEVDRKPVSPARLDTSIRLSRSALPSTDLSQATERKRGLEAYLGDTSLCNWKGMGSSAAHISR